VWRRRPELLINFSTCSYKRSCLFSIIVACSKIESWDANFLFCMICTIFYVCKKKNRFSPGSHVQLGWRSYCTELREDSYILILI
jgi:hypothetical protein